MILGFIAGWTSCVAFIAICELVMGVAARAKLAGGFRAQGAGGQTQQMAKALSHGEAL